MRTYTLTIWSHGETIAFRDMPTWPSLGIETTMRIRWLLLDLFHECFGKAPSFYWHKDGFMAQAMDGDHRNMVELEQMTDRAFWGWEPACRRCIHHEAACAAHECGRGKYHAWRGCAQSRETKLLPPLSTPSLQSIPATLRKEVA